MNLTRLMALGILARSGPSHGHHIRRVADVTNVGEWGGVSVGALYRELRAMEREGLVEAARTEKVGNRPERTVYAITAEGQIIGIRETGTMNDDLRIDRPEQEMILILWSNLARVGEPEQIEFVVSGFATRSGGNRRGKWLN